MIKAIIFDLGSVCLHIDWFKLNEEMMEKYGISTLVRSSGNQKLINLYGDSLRGKKETSEYFRELAKGKAEVNKVIHFYEKLYKKYKKVDKTSISLIKKLRRNYKVYCLTDTNKIHFDTHKEEKILNNFDSSFASFELGSIKADKITFKKVLRKIKIPAKEIAFVDDNEKNIENAKYLEFNAILFKNNKQLIKELRKLGVKI